MDEDFGYDIGGRLFFLFKALFNPAVTDAALGQALRKFVDEEGPHAFGMLTQGILQRMAYPETEDDDEEEEEPEPDPDDGEEQPQPAAKAG